MTARQLISPEGMEAMKRNLASLEKELTALQKEKNSLMNHRRGGSDSNMDYEQAEAEEWLLFSHISRIRQQIANSIVCDNKIYNSDVVNFGCVVEIVISDVDDKTETLSILFSDSDESSNLIKVSANSPIEKVIFHQKEGYIGNYTVLGNTFTVEIKKILKKE